jgi:signal transduction histidine kinase/ActR/RegA family two-component response regulator
VDGRARLPLRDSGGGIIATLDWAPPAVGAALLWKSLPTTLLLIICLGTMAWHLYQKGHRAAQALVENEARAFRLASHKSEFLTSMSHEIRTPLNGVLGMAQSLKADALPPAQREKVAVILDTGQILLAMLNDVFDLSKIEAGKFEIFAVDDDLVQAIYATRQSLQPNAEAKGLNIDLSCPPDFPHWLRYDPVRVRQCVSNLLANAIKFTDAGTITVTLAAEARDAVYAVSIDVADTGSSITPDRMARLFSAFTQADGAASHRFGETGLGLAITRQLARLMGGDVTVVSEPDKGVAFTFTFQAAAATRREDELEILEQASVLHVPDDYKFSDTKILVTEDNAINRQVIKLLLAPLGVSIAEAENGRAALEMLAAEPFDLVLLDIHMPIMDGVQTIDAIRRSQASWRTIPVIALTADATSGARERYLALGMNDYMSKPLDQSELHAKMFALLDKLYRPAEMVRDIVGPSVPGVSQEELTDLFAQIDRARAN